MRLHSLYHSLDAIKRVSLNAHTTLERERSRGLGWLGWLNLIFSQVFTSQTLQSTIQTGISTLLDTIIFPTNIEQSAILPGNLLKSC